MTPKSFANSIRKEVIEQNLDYYRDLLAMPYEQVKDGKIREIVHAFASMTKAQKESMLSIVEQAMIDTASNVLGILDGTTILANDREDFSLRYGDSDVLLNGDLQDYFLADIEENPIGNS